MSAQPIEHATSARAAGIDPTGAAGTAAIPTRPTAHRPPGTPGVVTPLRPRSRPAVGPALPRTSTARPWDRVRFVAHVPRPDILSGDTGEPVSEAPVPDEAEGDRLAAAVAAGAIEALLGVRSPAQLTRWLAPHLYDALVRRVGLAARLQGRPETFTHARVRTVVGCTPADGVREVSAVVHDGAKVRAVAVRLEAFRGRWRTVALEIG
ncbi:MAG: Rv3235 family protein [Actinomycetaceae bacterium]